MKPRFLHPLFILTLALPSSLLATTHYVDSTPTGTGNDGTSWPDAYADLQDALGIAISGDEIWVAGGTYYPDQGAAQTDDVRASTFQLISGVALYGGFQGLVTETELTDRDPATYVTILSGDLLQNNNTSTDAYNVVTGSNTDATAILDGFTITKGYADGSGFQKNRGGGFYNDSGSPTVSNCSFSNNKSNSGGGAVFNIDSAPTFTHCSFDNNEIDYNDGGAVANVESTSTFTYCSFTNNTASSLGGAVANYSSPVTFINCNFTGNSSAGGGGISNDLSSPLLINCQITGNRATVYGGALYNEDVSSPVMINCTIAGNKANTSDGGAFYNLEYSSPILTNCIIWRNKADDSETNAGATVSNYISSEPRYDHCLIANSGSSASWNSALGVDDGSNINQDPKFAAEIAPGQAPTTSGDYRLMITSPARDIGDSSPYINNGGPISEDLSGGSRFAYEGEFPLPITLDLGAYELRDFTSPEIESFVLTTEDTTVATSLEFSLTFDEEIVGLDLEDDLIITTTGTADYSSATITGGSPSSSFIITLNDTTGDGYFSISIKTTTGITDVFGNLITANAGIQNVIFISSDSTVHYVNAANGTPAFPYGTWVTAANSLSDVFANTAAGDQVWVAKGTYYPDEGVGQTDNNRTSTFSLQNNIALYGGFHGDEVFAYQRDSSPATNATFLSGDIDQDGSSSSNAYHVVTGSGTDATAILDGFTITGGNASVKDGTGANPRSNGGGLFNDAGSPSIRNCLLTENSAYYGGGAIYNNSSSSNISNSIFTGNTARTGGAISNDSSSPNISYSIFAGNSASSAGAIFNRSSSSPIITNTSFSGNSGIGAGAIFNFESSSPTFTNCTFSGNRSSAWTLIYNKSSSSPTFSNCIIWGNSKSETYNGHIDNDPSSSTPSIPSFSHCLIEGSGGSSNWDSELGTDEGNNLDADPIFVTAIDPSTAPSTAGNLRLYLSSPGIDAGDTTTYTSNGGLATDLAGNTRTFDDPNIADSGTGTPAYLDLGAYEAYDFTSPSVESFTLTTAETLDAASLEFAITFDEDMVNFDGEADLNITTTASAAYSGVTITGSGSSYTITLTGTSGEGAFALSIKTDSGVTDLSGNVLSSNIGIENVLLRSSASPTHYANADNATPIAPYSTWATAATNIQDALDYTVSGDEIHVAAGIYYPDEGTDQTDDDRSATFQLKTGVTILGGYTSNGGTRDYATNLTILSGDLKQNDGADFSNNADNSYHIVTSSTVDATAVLDGFTITAGNANGSSDTEKYGGAIYNSSASPSITNCSFSENYSESEGAAIYNTTSSPIISGCSFSTNSTNSSGAAISNTSSAPVITNCSFSENSARTYGGAIYNGSSSPTINNCSFSGNSSEGSGGAMSNRTGSSPTINNCSFSGNSSETTGGAMYNNSHSSPNLTNCTFSGNSAASNGGAISSNSSCYPILTNCIIWNNRASASTSEQTASLYNKLNSDPTFIYCIVENYSDTPLNNSGAGGGNNIDGTASANDPQFVTTINAGSAPTTAGDLRLSTNSPAINAGDGTSDTSNNGTATDLDGTYRFVGTIDLGAYEAYSTFATLFSSLNANDDANGNGLSNYVDYAMGADPTAPHDTNSATKLIGDQLTFSTRAYAADVVSEYKKSTDLSTWDSMVENVDYTYVETTNNGVQDQVTLQLTPALLAEPKVFFTEAFTTE